MIATANRSRDEQDRNKSRRILWDWFARAGELEVDASFTDATVERLWRTSFKSTGVLSFAGSSIIVVMIVEQLSTAHVSRATLTHMLETQD